MADLDAAAEWAYTWGGGSRGRLAATGFFSPVALGMVATGEQAGNVDGMLHKLADFQEAEADHATHQLVIIGSTLFYLLIALFVAAIVIGFYGGYARSLSTAGQ